MGRNPFRVVVIYMSPLYAQSMDSKSINHFWYLPRKLKLTVLDWIPKSPDLNPIEILWSILDKRLASRPIYSRAALMERLQEEWGNIDQDLCIKLVESKLETNTSV